MACDAATLLAQAASNGYTCLDDRSLKIAILQLLCAGPGSGGGGAYFISTPGGDPTGVITANRPSMAYDALGNIWVNTGAGWLKAVTAQAAAAPAPQVPELAKMIRPSPFIPNPLPERQPQPVWARLKAYLFGILP